MRFAQLLDLPSNSIEIIDIAALEAALPATPASVARQFLSEHARKPEFQDQYEFLDLTLVKWRLEMVAAERLVNASVYVEFRQWYDNVANRLERFKCDSWKCIDSRKDVCTHWEHHQTWLVPPVLLEGFPNAQTVGLHLVEGHTRVGLLSGLVRRGMIAPDTKHQAWVGACGSFKIA